MDHNQELSPEQAQRYWQELEAEEDADAGNIGDRESISTATENSAAADEGNEEHDPYAGLSDYQKAKLIGLETQNAQLANRLRNVEGHIGGLKSQISAQQSSQNHRAQAASELQQARGNPKAMEEWRETYPEFVDGVESLMQARLHELRSELASNRGPQGITPEQLDQRLNEHTVDVIHPGWKTEVMKPEFIGWIRQQNNDVRSLAASPVAADAVRLLNIYKEGVHSNSQAVIQRNARLEAQASIPSGKSGGGRGKSVDQMTDAEYWAYLDRQDKKGKN
ncbi:hypothetical protein [Undibacterium sp.]|uniref:hypothetical protein n=1 Tax=Undibacterium sp. TaxID=1914977 RepID=UPI00374DC57A